MITQADRKVIATAFLSAEFMITVLRYRVRLISLTGLQRPKHINDKHEALIHNPKVVRKKHSSMLSAKNKWEMDIQTSARMNQNRMSTVTKRNVEEQVDVSESGRKWQTSNRAEYGEEHKENKRIRCTTNLFVKSYVKRQEEDEYDQVTRDGSFDAHVEKDDEKK